ncbi:MAG: Cna B-type domain-containing protein [Hornefia sp.]|nr:Cna B-type domain-containing protein [Hornefia sp.]
MSKNFRGKRGLPALLALLMSALMLVPNMTAFAKDPGNENREGAAASGIDYEFDVQWANAVSSDVKDYHYSDETRKHLVFTPSRNEAKTATLSYSLKLKNDANTVLPAGAIKIVVPGYILKDWNGGTKTNAKAYEYIPHLKWQIPKAPATSTVSDFNYTENSDGTITVSNFKPVSGGASFSFEQGFTFRPNFVKVDKDNDGEETGSITAPVNVKLSIDAGKPVEEEKNFEISVKNKNELTDIKLKQADLDQYKGVYFDWQDQWGDKPADSDKYFYVIWYADVERSNPSMIPFKYEVKPEDDGIGGEIVGIKKDTYEGGKRGFVYKGYLNTYTDTAYTDIAKGGKSILTQDGLWGEFKDRNGSHGIHTLYGLGYYDWCSARFSILKRYPKTIIEEEKKKGTDLSKDGFKIPNRISLTDTLANGVTKTHDVVTAEADIHIHNYKGWNNIWKYDSASSVDGLSAQQAAQDFLLQDLDVDFNHRSHVKSTFTLHTTTSSSEEPEFVDGAAKVKPYTAEVEDGKLYHSTKYTNYNDTYSNQSKNFDELKDGDATYKSVYFSLKEFDARKTDGGWQEIVNPSKEYEKYKPIDIFVRYSGEKEYKKLGQITFAKDGTQNYLSADGKTEVKNVGSQNPVIFPKNVAGLKYSHTSTFFKSDLYAMPMLELHPTDNMKELIRKDRERTDKGTYLSSDARLKVTTEGGRTHNSDTTSQRMRVTSKILTALSYNTYIYKEAGDLTDDVKTGKQTIPVRLAHGNLMSLWDSGVTNFDYIDEYIAKKLAFYDLLPAGTYVEPGSIKVSGSAWNYTYKIIDPSNYTVEYRENWEGSGQTMMIITVDVPESNREFYKKAGANHGSRIFVDYKLVNTYNNISDRGNNVLNTIGVKNLSDDVKFKSNAKTSGIVKKPFYKELMGDTPEKWMFEQRNMNFNPVKVKQAGVSKKAANDHDNEFKEQTKIIAGNKYAYKLAYSMSSETRADNIVMYDVLENGNGKEDSEWKGKLDWIDLSSIKQKPAYGHSGETCAPAVYISKLSPDKIKKDVEDNTVWEKVEEDKLKDIGKISGITAIAIDCRTTDKGNPFVLDRGMGLQADIHMKSPDDKAIDGKKTVNKTDVMARLFVGTEAAPGSTAKLTEASAKVIAKKLDISLEKASDPVTGTKANPTVIENKEGDAIKYTLTVKNNDTDLDVRNIKLEDILPEGLSPDMEKITATCEELKLNKKQVLQANEIGCRLTGQKLEFSINSLPAGSTVFLDIPSKITKKFVKTTLFDNTAKITSAEDIERNIVSETTHHKTVQQYKLDYAVQPDPIHGVPAGSAAPPEVTGIEYDTVKTLAQPLATSETADSNGVKGIWKFTGWSSKADDIAGTKLSNVAIKEDTTVYGKWEFNPTRDINVEKIWQDAKIKGRGGEEVIWKKAVPSPVTVELYRNGEKTAEKTLTPATGWSFTFTNLPIAEKEGQEPYKYTVKEKGLDKSGDIKLSGDWYRAKVTGDAENGFTVTNKVLAQMVPMEIPTRDIEVKKVWLNHKGDDMPEDKVKDNKVVVELYKNDQPTGKIQELNEGNKWSTKFTKLPVSESLGGNEFVYTVREKGLSEKGEITQNGLTYRAEVQGNQKSGFTVKNTLVNQKISVSGEKHWNDENNQDGIRPEKITVKLKENGELTEKTASASASTDWKYSFSDLMTYDEKGDKIEYSIKEEPVAEYETEVAEAKKDENGSVVYDITNTHKPFEKAVKVKKVWKDAGNKNNLRPDEIKVNLIANGNRKSPVRTEIIREDEKGSWKTEFAGLPVNEAGKKIEYTVEETPVKNYSAAVYGNEEDGFTITNTEIQKPAEKIDEPGTGDNSSVAMYLLLTITALLLLSVVIAGKKSHESQDN